MRIISFHALSDLSGTRVGEYGIPLSDYFGILDVLTERGASFVDPNQFMESVKQGTFPEFVVSQGASFLITFDDCYSDLASAFSYMDVHDIKALIFPVAGLIGATNQWDEGIAPRQRLLEAEQLGNRAAKGWVVGLHTYTHADLVTLGDDQVVTEIQMSASRLDQLCIPYEFALAYPYGSFNARVARLAREAGVIAAFTCEPGALTPSSDLLSLPRFELHRGDVGAQLLRKISDAGVL